MEREDINLYISLLSATLAAIALWRERRLNLRLVETEKSGEIVALRQDLSEMRVAILTRLTRREKLRQLIEARIASGLPHAKQSIATNLKNKNDSRIQSLADSDKKTSEMDAVLADGSLQSKDTLHLRNMRGQYAATKAFVVAKHHDDDLGNDEAEAQKL